MAQSNLSRTLKLNNGLECPRVGLGTWQATNEAEISASLRAAIVDCGYRHIDTALSYNNEAVIGATLASIFAEGKIKRSDLFVTTKQSMYTDDPVGMLRNQLAALKLDYVDLYLSHTPIPFHYEGSQLVLHMDKTFEDCWQAVVKCHEAGLAQAVGVSNYSVEQLQTILAKGGLKPAMNQIESHPYFSNTELVNYCHSVGIAVTAYSPFGNPAVRKSIEGNRNIFTDPKLIEIASRHKKSAGQVALRWQLQRGNIVIPKSVSPARIQENFNVWDFELSDEEMAAIGEMNDNFRVCCLWDKKLLEHPSCAFTELSPTAV